VRRFSGGGLFGVTTGGRVHSVAAATTTSANAVMATRLLGLNM
jgi:uncharacterized membrane protein YdjX (TVP38/TMEM64 family)